MIAVMNVIIKNLADDLDEEIQNMSCLFIFNFEYDSFLKPKPQDWVDMNG